MDWQAFGATLFTILAVFSFFGTIGAVTSPITSGDDRTALWAIPFVIACAVFGALAAGLY